MEAVSAQMPATEQVNVTLAAVNFVRTLDARFVTPLGGGVDLLAMSKALPADVFAAYLSSSRLMRSLKKLLAQ